MKGLEAETTRLLPTRKPGVTRDEDTCWEVAVPGAPVCTVGIGVGASAWAALYSVQPAWAKTSTPLSNS